MRSGWGISAGCFPRPGIPFPRSLTEAVTGASITFTGILSARKGVRRWSSARGIDRVMADGIGAGEVGLCGIEDDDHGEKAEDEKN